MSKIYNELLRDPRWQQKKSEICIRANWQCEHCGDKKTELHVHHTFYDGRNPWAYPNDSLKCLCKNCHKAEHNKKLPEKAPKLLAKRNLKQKLLLQMNLVLGGNGGKIIYEEMKSGGSRWSVSVLLNMKKPKDIIR